MSTTPIEDCWRQIEEQQNFCCDDHRDLYKGMFFTGAMSAMNALTGWDPDRPAILCISMASLSVVVKELTALHAAAQVDDAVAQAKGQVRQ